MFVPQAAGCQRRPQAGVYRRRQDLHRLPLYTSSIFRFDGFPRSPCTTALSPCFKCGDAGSRGWRESRQGPKTQRGLGDGGASRAGGGDHRDGAKGACAECRAGRRRSNAAVAGEGSDPPNVEGDEGGPSGTDVA
jgi:hypothetical protein